MWSLFIETTDTGVLKNLDLHYYLNNTSAVNNYSGMLGSNYGTISNIMITLEEATEVPNINLSLLARNNYGTIENFVIHSKASLSTSFGSSLLVKHNAGIIKNGYAYGEAINATYTSGDDRARKEVAVFASMSDGGSTISNVYNLIPINVTSSPTAGDGEKLVGDIVGWAIRATITNAYSSAEGENRLKDNDPNVGDRSGAVSFKNYIITLKTYIVIQIILKRYLN